MTAQGAERLAALDWRETYQDFGPELLGYLSKLTRDAATAQDLLQETFEQGIRRESQLRDATAVRPWLYRIAHNRAVSHLRRTRRWDVFGRRTDATVDPADSVAEVELVRRALRSIAPEQAACLVLRERGFSRKELSAICGVSEEAIKSRLSRGEAHFVAVYRRMSDGSAR